MKTRNTRKVLSALLALLVALALIPAAGFVTAHAATGMATIDIGTLGGANADNSAASATESQWRYDDATKRLSLRTSSGKYTLTGTNANLSVVVGWDNINLTLSGANITATSGGFPGIEVFQIGCTITLIGTNAATGSPAGTGIMVYENCIITSTEGGSLATTSSGVNGIHIQDNITLRITGNAHVTATGATGWPAMFFRPGANLLIGDNAKLTVINNTAGSEYYTFGKADAGATHKWKLTPATILSSGALTDASIDVQITTGVTATIERELIPVPINIAAIAGVTAPVGGATPATAVIATAQYTGTVAWNPAAATFGYNTAYTATITLTPKAGFTLTGVAANFFTVAGATATNAAGSGVITAVFPATGAAPITPTITGPTALKVLKGYAATSTGAFTVAGTPAPSVALSGNTGGGKITWDGTKLNIAAGLAPGEYKVTLTASNAAGSKTADFTLTVAKTIFSTKYEAKFGNWLLFFLCFGFIWMWFGK